MGKVPSGLKNKRNLAGIRFGNLVAIERVGTAKNEKATWACLCDCGNKAIVDSNSLRRGHIKSCGCLRYEYLHKSKANNIEGQKFNMLKVIKRIGSDKNRNALFLCRCDCGNDVVVRATDITNGRKKTCGCKFIQALTKKREKNIGLYEMILKDNGLWPPEKNE